MTKITEEAMDAYSKALKGRTIKRYDVGERNTVVTRVTYDEKARPISVKRLDTLARD